MKKTIQLCMMATMMLFSSCDKQEKFIVSGYTPENGPDIMLCAINKEGRADVLAQYNCGMNPSFFTQGKDGLFYFVNEVDTFSLKQGGGITTLRIDTKTNAIEKLGAINQGGPGPCHVLLSNDGHFLITANYGSGSISVVRLDEKGIPSEVTDVIKYGEKSHPHMTHFNKRTQQYYITDLGLDRIYVLRLDTESGRLINSDTPYFKTASGSGPRHMVADIHDVNLYVINELNSSISVFDIVANIPGLKQAVSTLPEGNTDKNYCADIHFSPGGKYLYASNRGMNSIAVFKTSPAGTLTPEGYFQCGGNWPRNFTIGRDGKIMLIANQRSDSVTFFKLNINKISHHEPFGSVTIHAPACVGFIE